MTESKGNNDLNRIILIGNGFDLAHGLETSYKHFINDFCEQIQSDNDMWDAVMSAPKSKVNINDTVIEEAKFKNKFFYAIKSDLSIQNWVDVEKVYYKQLVKCMEYELNHSKPKYLIEDLNSEFGFFEKKLKEYLSKEFGNKYSSIIEPIDSIESYLDKTIEKEENEQEYNKTLIVNFNYTSTDKKYAEKIDQEDTIIRLHGELENQKNPVIFGYGDELAKNYKEIEELDNNDYLEYVKSIKYSLTDNYCDLWDFINNEGAYHIYLFGLSCGNSDRTLLNELFEHQNCRRIKIFYWQKDDMSDDFLEIYKNISRIFTKKNNLRNIVATKPKSKPLVPIKDLQEFLKTNFVLFNDNGHQFYMSKFLVTQTQYKSIMGNNPSYFKGEKLPVEYVSWYDAAEFCNRLSKEFKQEERYVEKYGYLKENTTKKGFRLPTEKEWVYAAKHCRKDNVETSEYAGTNDKNELKKYAWFDENSDGRTHEVGTAENASESELAIHDMSGNVWEWCEDWYDTKGSGRVLRGGSWSSDAQGCRVAYRSCFTPGANGFSGGFRLVLVP